MAAFVCDLTYVLHAAAQGTAASDAALVDAWRAVSVRLCASYEACLRCFADSTGEFHTVMLMRLGDLTVALPSWPEEPLPDPALLLAAGAAPPDGPDGQRLFQLLVTVLKVMTAPSMCAHQYDISVFAQRGSSNSAAHECCAA